MHLLDAIPIAQIENEISSMSLQLPTDLPHGLESDVRALVEKVLPDGTITNLSGTTHLHSLNNQIRLVQNSAGATQFVLRLPRAATATDLYIDRKLERRAVMTASANGIAPPLLGSSPSGVLLSEYVHSERSWEERDWHEGSRSEWIRALVRRLLLTPAGGTGWLSTYDRLSFMLATAARRGSSLAADAAIIERLSRIRVERDADNRYPQCLAHHDMWNNNLLPQRDRVWLIDY